MQHDDDDALIPELRDFAPSLTTDEASVLLGMDRSAVSRLLHQGQLPGFRVGGRWRIRRSELQKVMLGQWKGPEDLTDEDHGD